MARNKMTDLNDHLFAQLERLNDETIKGEDMKAEIDKAKAISSVASQIINSNRVVLEAAKLVGEGNLVAKELPETFGLDK